MADELHNRAVRCRSLQNRHVVKEKLRQERAENHAFVRRFAEQFVVHHTHQLIPDLLILYRNDVKRELREMRQEQIGKALIAERKIRLLRNRFHKRC